MKAKINLILFRAKNNSFLAFLFTFIIVASCARMSSPSGGAKDVDPPVALKSKPVNYATNFKDNKILIEFDEYIVLKNIRQELLVSPPLPEKPEIKQRGKTLVIKVNNELKDSTTYNFNFYNAIVDLNEGNPLKNFQFEFSTGSEFDSIYLGGIMHDAFNFSTAAGWYVMLYDSFNDSLPRTTLPNYVAKTDEKGRFFITNLKNKPYYIFGLNDMNNNMLFDLPNEKIAFLDSAFSPDFIEHIFVDTVSIIKSISPNLKDTIRYDTLVSTKRMITTINNVRLYAFVEEFEQQYFKQAYRNEKQQVIFTFNQELKDSFSIIPLLEFEIANELLFDKSDSSVNLVSDTAHINSDSLSFQTDQPIKDSNLNDFIKPTEWFFAEKFYKNDSIVLWVIDSAMYNNDSLRFQVNYTMKDSNNNNYIKTDTLLLTYKAPEKKENKKKDKKEGGKFNLNFLTNSDKEEVIEDTVIPPSELTFITNAKAPFELNKPIELIARFPIKEIDKSQIELLRVENDTVKIPLEFELSQDKSEVRKYKITFEKDEEEMFELFIPAGAITDIYGNINDTLKFKFKTRPLDYYATIAMEIIGVKENAIVQLLSDKAQVIEEKTIASDTTILFEYLAPAKFFFKMYYDSNGNGKWDTGNYKELKQAEKVFYYPYFPEALETKSNVDVENTWELYPELNENQNAPLIKTNTDGQ